MSHAWALQDAKARFSEVAKLALREGPQHVTVHGEPAVVILSEKQFKSLTEKNTRPSWVDFFAAGPFHGVELDLRRNKDTGRTLRL